MEKTGLCMLRLGLCKVDFKVLYISSSCFIFEKIFYESKILGK